MIGRTASLYSVSVHTSCCPHNSKPQPPVKSEHHFLKTFHNLSCRLEEQSVKIKLLNWSKIITPRCENLSRKCRRNKLTYIPADWMLAPNPGTGRSDQFDLPHWCHQSTACFLVAGIWKKKWAILQFVYLN